MACIFPEAAIQHLALAGRIGLERLELHIANRFEGDANHGNHRAEDRNGRQAIGAREQNSQLCRQTDDEQQWNLHRPRPQQGRLGEAHPLLVHRMTQNFLVTGVHPFLAPAQEQMRPEPDPPKSR